MRSFVTISISKIPEIFVGIVGPIFGWVMASSDGLRMKE